MERMTASEYRRRIGKPKTNKYKVAPKPDRTWVGEYRGRNQTIVFGSKAEMERFEHLKWKQEIGVVSHLMLQESFPIGIKKRVYRADFSYFDERDKKWVIEDVKGKETDVFKIKWDALDTLYPGIERRKIKK